MTDVVQDAIREGRIGAGNVSFKTLRNVAGRDRGCWDQLDRGRKIITSYEQLDQYLYSYGPMTQSQWLNFLPKVTIPDGPVQILDHGCGQGLAGVLMFDSLGPKFVNRVESVVLVEPSSLALRRAIAVLGCYLGNRPIVAINKKLDQLKSRELMSVESASNIHLLSNVLDVEGYDHFSLFRKMLKTKGRHVVLAVSHNRDFCGGAGRFKELEEYISEKKNRPWIALKASQINEFKCGRDGKYDAISWELDVEVLHGSI